MGLHYDITFNEGVPRQQTSLRVQANGIIVTCPENVITINTLALSSTLSSQRRLFEALLTVLSCFLCHHEGYHSTHPLMLQFRLRHRYVGSFVLGKTILYAYMGPVGGASANGICRYFQFYRAAYGMEIATATHFGLLLRNKAWNDVSNAYSLECGREASLCFNGRIPVDSIHLRCRSRRPQAPFHSRVSRDNCIPRSVLCIGTLATASRAPHKKHNTYRKNPVHSFNYLRFGWHSRPDSS